MQKESIVAIARRRINETPNPSPVEAANQIPDQGQKESTERIISQQTSSRIFIDPDNEPTPAQRYMAARNAAAQAAVNTVLNDDIAFAMMRDIILKGYDCHRGEDNA